MSSKNTTFKELQENYHKISEKYKELYGNTDYLDLPVEGCELLVEKLEADLKLKEAKYDEIIFNRCHKPVIMHRIGRIRSRIRSQKFLESKV